MSENPGGVVVYVRPESDQLFLLFTGNGERLGFSPVEFVATTGIGRRNIAVFRDPYRAGYQRGISKEHDSLDGIVRWVKEQLQGRLSHVKEVFCAGNSGGGTPTLYVGHRLEVKAAWCFAGLVSNRDSHAERRAGKTRLLRRFLGRDELGDLTKEEQEKLLAAESDPEVAQYRFDSEENPEAALDRELLGRLVRMLKDEPRRTHFHFYYAESNPMDRLVAESFVDCPNVALHAVTPRWRNGQPPPRSCLVTPRPDHGIVPVLSDLGKLRGVFSGYL